MAKKRDRAAYMRDYRAKRKVDAPTLTDALRRIAVLEDLILHPSGTVVLNRDTYEAMVAQGQQASSFARPRPAPKYGHQPAPTARK